MIDDKVLWKKLSASISYYLKDVDLYKTDKEIIKGYLYYCLEENEGKCRYLDKKTFEYVNIENELLEKVKDTLSERIEKRREKTGIDPKEKESSKDIERKDISSNKNNVEYIY